MKRIGIVAGTFDPVHTGHIAFALQAIKETNLDKVYFLPESKPRRKEGVVHIAHRLAMLKNALKPYPNLEIMETVDKQFSVSKTLPRIQKKFLNKKIFFLIGADKELKHMSNWPLVDKLLQSSGLIIALRQNTREQTEHLLKELPVQPKALYLLDTKYSEVSSAKIRKSLFAGKRPEGALPSVLKYADKNWLYVSVPSEVS